jgi:hypothetical protein
MLIFVAATDTRQIQVQTTIILSDSTFSWFCIPNSFYSFSYYKKASIDLFWSLKNWEKLGLIRNLLNWYNRGTISNSDERRRINWSYYQWWARFQGRWGWKFTIDRSSDHVPFERRFFWRFRYSLDYEDDLVKPQNYSKVIFAIIVCLAIIAISVWSLSKTKPNNFQQNNIIPVVSNNSAPISKIPEEKRIVPV